MKANELRIGNYVNISLKSSELRTDYDEITTSGLMDLQTNKEISSFRYEPIHLTEDWLVKFGFEKKTRTFVLCNLSVKQQTKGYFFARNIMIEHVHQLQNLFFALTGKELIYNDSK